MLDYGGYFIHKKAGMVIDKTHIENETKPTLAGAFDEFFALFGFYPVIKDNSKPTPVAETWNGAAPKRGILELEAEFAKFKALLEKEVEK